MDGSHSNASSTQAQIKLPPLGARRAHEKIVFVDALAGDYGAIYSIRLDGRGLRRLAAEAYDPAPSPDRTQIAYTDGGEIFVMRSNGTGKRAVAYEGDISDQPAWSPDGRRLVFVSTSSPSSSGALFAAHLLTVRADGSEQRRLKGALSGVDFPPGPSWIDARHILVTAALGQLAVLNSQTGQVERRIALPRPGTQPAPEAADLSPDGKEIAYTECVNDDCSATALDLITFRGRLIRRIPGGRSGAWSPEGYLLYACCGEPATLGHKSRIFVAPAGGGAARPVTPDSIQVDSPVWIG